VSDASAWEVLAVRYGTRSTTKSECYLDYASYGEPDAQLGMDYFFYVLRRGEKTILVDVGFDPVVGERRGRTVLHAPVDALRELGVAPMSVAQIVVTHLHYDHVGNLLAFPDAELLLHERELDFWCGPAGVPPEHAAPIEPEELDYVASAHRDGRVRLLDGSGSIADGIEVVCVGGHSPGQLVLVVSGRSGPVVLASDAVHYYEELERGWPFEIVVDLEEMVAGYATVKRLAGEHGAPIVAGHDPLVCERFPALEGERQGLGVRLS
jgi:glyoxylase-like metal-dependent hydrolase (beta-lactamase superfamily II)